MKLDELARDASVAARAGVSHLEPPPIDERRRNPVLVPAVAVAATIAVVVGGLVALGPGSDDGPGHAEAVPDISDPPHLVLGPEVTGWDVAFAADLDAIGDGSPTSPSFSYYGSESTDPFTDDPFPDGDLVIGVLVDGDGLEGMEGTPTDVRSTSGVVLPPGDGLPMDAAGVRWIEEGATGEPLDVILLSRTSTADELVGLADQLTIDVATGTVTPPADLGLDLLVDADGLPLGAIARGGQPGSIVTYTRAEDTSLTLSSTAGDVANTATALRWWTDDARTIEIDGVDGLAATLASERPEDPGTTVVVWTPEPGVIASLSSFGTGGEVDLVALAESVVELDDAEWSAIVTEAGAPRIDRMDTTYGSGGGELDGVEYVWALGERDDLLCFDVSTAEGGRGSCRPNADRPMIDGTAKTFDTAFGDTVGAVLIASDDAVETIRETSGTWSVERVDPTWFVAFGPTDVQPSFEVIVDGDVVDTLDAAVEPIAEEAPVAADATAESGFETSIGTGSGEFEGSAYEWELGLGSDEVCLHLAFDEVRAGCAPLDDTGDATPLVLVDVGGDLRAMLIRAEPRVDEIVDESGDFTLDRNSTDGVAWFVAVGPGDAEPSLVARVDGETIRFVP